MEKPCPDYDYNTILKWLNTLELGIFFTAVEIVREHSYKLQGWVGVCSLSLVDNEKQKWDIDLRYAAYRRIYKQNLFDYGWNEDIVMCSSERSESNRNKLIIYLCDFPVGSEIRHQVVPQRFLVGSYWKTVHHLYMPLSEGNPFYEFNTRRDREIKYKQDGKLRSDNRNAGCSSPKDLESFTATEQYLLQSLPVRRRVEGGARTKGIYKQSLQGKQLISVITVVFNGTKYLEQSIQSVINQQYDNVEYIIIDGGSNDGTLEIILKYENEIDYWTSESDNGIYHAMNKGLGLASGDYVIFINADDSLFAPDSLSDICGHADCFLNNTVGLDELGNVVSRYRVSYSSRDSVEKMIAYGLPCSHQGFVAKKSLLRCFDDRFKIDADRVVITDMLRRSTSVQLNNKFIAFSRVGGASSNNRKLISEKFKVVQKMKLRKVFYIYYLPHLVYVVLRQFAMFLGLVDFKRKNYTKIIAIDWNISKYLKKILNICCHL